MNITKTKLIKTAISTAAALGIATIMATASAGSANAGNFSIDLYLGNGTGIYYSDRNGYNASYWGGYGPRYGSYNNHRQNRYRQPPRRKICGPRRAVKKAHRLGLKHPQVRRVRDRKVIVAGFQYGYPTKMIFQRYSNCRLIRTVRLGR